MKLSTTTATTIAGIAAGLAAILQTVSDTIQAGKPLNWLQIVLGIGIMVLGVYAKGIEKAPPAAAVMLQGFGTTVALMLALMCLQACASTKTELTSATFANGHRYPLCLEVTQQTPFGVELLAGFCANVQKQIDEKAAQYRATYPRATITELRGPERFTLQ